MAWRRESDGDDRLRASDKQVNAHEIPASSNCLMSSAASDSAVVPQDCTKKAAKYLINMSLNLFIKGQLLLALFNRGREEGNKNMKKQQTMLKQGNWQLPNMYSQLFSWSTEAPR
jgi:hypothetical protein